MKIRPVLKQQSVISLAVALGSSIFSGCDQKLGGDVPKPPEAPQPLGGLVNDLGQKKQPQPLGGVMHDLGPKEQPQPLGGEPPVEVLQEDR